MACDSRTVASASNGSTACRPAVAAVWRCRPTAPVAPASPWSPICSMRWNLWCRRASLMPGHWSPRFRCPTCTRCSSCCSTRLALISSPSVTRYSRPAQPVSLAALVPARPATRSPAIGSAATHAIGRTHRWRGRRSPRIGSGPMNRHVSRRLISPTRRCKVRRFVRVSGRRRSGGCRC
jgi:hypothetical protein